MRSWRRADAALLLAALILAPASAAAQAPVELAVCRYLPRHTPTPDVQYRPGVDVHGRPVAPADLPGSAGAAPMERFEIPVTLRFARRLGFATPGADALPATTEIGRLTVQGDRILFNGQPIGPAAEADLVAVCRGVR